MPILVMPILMKLLPKVSTPRCSTCGKKTKEPYMHWFNKEHNLGLIRIRRKPTTFCSQNCGITWLEKKD